MRSSSQNKSAHLQAADLILKQDANEPPKAIGLMPDYFAESISAIDFKDLSRRGVHHLVVDVDHTLATYRSLELDPATVNFLQSVQRDGLVETITIASNSRRDLRSMADSIGATVVRPRFLQRKPSRKYYQKLVKAIGCRPSEAVMVGDKMVNDIWGANRVGMYTVLVNPIGPDMLIDRLLGRRYWGKRYLKHHRPVQTKERS